ncbi:site-specific integrase [Methyloglobulus sp.]|uniref:tyrosine-type recombinase/integrase n=1 Tax=Methyloglobulus sp. TaxID=2518622 RepID=UPI0032B74AC5
MATIRQRDEKWNALVRKEGVNISKTFQKKSNAIKWANEQEVLIEQGLYQSKQKTITLSKLLDRWTNEVLIHQKSYPNYQYFVKTINRSIGDKPLTDITPQLLVKYRDTRLKQVSNQTAKHELSIIRRALKKGIEWGYCSSVPYVAMPSLKGQARTRRLTASEMQLLLSTARANDEYLYHVIMLLKSTAMRRGELAKIKLTDIDLNNRLITLNDTKNGDDRIIPLSLVATESVNYLIKHRNSEHLLKWQKEWLTIKFITLCKSIGIENFRLHDLRHEAVSMLFEKGLNSIEVSTISGHKDMTMLRRYTHINPKTLLTKIDGI